VEALRYRVMSTSLYHSKVQEEHARLVELIAGGQIAKAARLLEQHIQRVRRVQSEAEWGGGRLKRKDYRFRNYAEILI
jgi:DNA-binding GntR family transcriptional regulator